MVLLPAPFHPHLSGLAHRGRSLLHPEFPRQLAIPHRRVGLQHQLLALRRAGLLVYPRHHGPVPYCAVLHDAHRAPPHVPLDSAHHHHLVYHGGMGATPSYRREPSGDILEPGTHLPHRHQLRQIRQGKAHHRRAGVVDAHHDVAAHVRHMPLPGADSAQRLPTLCGAHALHSFYRDDHHAAQPYLSPHTAMVQHLLCLCGNGKPRSVPPSYPFRALLRKALPSGLLVDLRGHRRHHAAAGMAAAQVHKWNHPRFFIHEESRPIYL